MANTNCLQGIQCPSCQSDGPFSIVVSAWAKVSDDGIEETTEHEWGKGSTIICLGCNKQGTVLDFSR